MKSLVSTTNLVAYRRGKPLFAPINMDVRRGDMAFVHGKNGAGKSTLLNCLSARYFDRTGDLRCPIEELSYLPQGQHHPQTLRLSEMAPIVRGYCIDRYHFLLHLLDIPEKTADRLPSLLSGGELQKARLLLALLRCHSVLFLDEPFANLDIECRRRVAEELRRTQCSRAAILVSHPSNTGLDLQGVKELELHPPHN